MSGIFRFSDTYSFVWSGKGVRLVRKRGRYYSGFSEYDIMVVTALIYKEILQFLTLYNRISGAKVTGVI